MKLLITQFIQPPVTSSLLATNILPSTLFSNTIYVVPSEMQTISGGQEENKYMIKE
jgi:hypothetical protein